MDDLKKPILPGKGASDYERYLHTDELLSLQNNLQTYSNLPITSIMNSPKTISFPMLELQILK